MKRGIFFLVFFLVAASLFSQGKDGVIKVRKRVNTTPMIAGVTGGEIDAALLCVDSEGIIINKNIRVTSFVFIAELGNREIEMKQNGNKLDKAACEVVGLLKSGANVFFNEIAVIDDKGRESLTTPMRLRLK